jgi:acetylglutamate kinase
MCVEIWKELMVVSKQVENFLEKLEKNPELAEKFRNIKTQEDILDIIEPYLNGLDKKEFLEELYLFEQKGSKLSESDLDSVAGGKVTKKDLKDFGKGFWDGFSGVFIGLGRGLGLG